MANPNPSYKIPKGTTPNPNGRPPKGYSITEWFKNMLAAQPEVKDAIAKSIMKKALEGDTTAQKLVWSYMDGLPKQVIGGEGDSGAIVIKIVDYGSNNNPTTKAKGSSDDQ